MEEKKPQFVFWQPKIFDLEEAIFPVRLHEHLDRLDHLREVHVPCIIFAPAGIGVSCGKIALTNCEEAIMFVVSHQPSSRLNEKVLFDLSELITERPQQLEAMILRSPAIIMSAIERLILEDCSILQASVIPFMAQERFNYDTFIDLKVIKTKPQKPIKPLNKMFNSQSRQNIKHFIRKK